MINTSAPLFGKETFQNEIEKQQAELYSRLYKYAAEDFVSNADMKEFMVTLTAFVKSLQDQLMGLMNVMSTHTHNVPAHTHPIPPHVHPDPVSGMTGQNVGAYVTSPTTLMTQTPIQSASMKWNTLPAPKIMNTTGSLPNVEGNMVTIGSSKIGPAVVSSRRMKTPEILNVQLPTIPILNSTLLKGIL